MKYLSATCARASIESFFLHLREHCGKVTGVSVAKNLSFLHSALNYMNLHFACDLHNEVEVSLVTAICTYIAEVVLDFSSRLIDFFSLRNVYDLTATPASERFHNLDCRIKPCVRERKYFIDDSTM